jgi:hypothetical protein
VISLPVTSWFSAGTVANDTSTGSLSWDSDALGSALVGTEVQNDDGVLAHGGASSLASTYYLKSTNFGIGTGDIPTGSTINGVEVEVRQYRAAFNPTVASAAVFLVKAGTVVGSSFGISGDWATTETVVTYGSSAQLGGESWTRSDILSSNFGTALSVLYNSARTSNTPNVYVDQVRLRVYYTEPAPINLTVSVSSMTVSGRTYGVTAGSGGSVATRSGSFFGLLT